MTTEELRTPPMDTVERVAAAIDAVVSREKQPVTMREAATAAISAYRAAQWQPIETAPKDGRRVLIFSESHVYIAYWSEDAYFGETENARPGWQIFNCEMDHWYSVATEMPTHWQPLPAPPVSEER